MRTLPVLYVAWVLIGAAMAMTLYEAAFASADAALSARLQARGDRGDARRRLRQHAGIPGAGLADPDASAGAVRCCCWLRRGAAGGSGQCAGVARAAAGVGRRVVARKARAAVCCPAGASSEALRSRAFWLLAACFSAYAFVVAAVLGPCDAGVRGQGAERGAGGRRARLGRAGASGRARRCICSAWRALTPRMVGLVVLCGLPLAHDAVRADGECVGAARVRAALRRFATASSRSCAVLPCRRYFGARAVGRIGGALSAISLAGRALAPLLTAWALLALGSYRALALALASAEPARADCVRAGEAAAYRRLLSVMRSFSRFIWKRVRKLLPSSTYGICAGTTTASTL